MDIAAPPPPSPLPPVRVDIPLLGHNPLAWDGGARTRWDVVDNPSKPYSLHVNTGAFEALVEALNKNQNPSPAAAQWHGLHLQAQQIKASASPGPCHRFIVKEHCADLWRQAGVVPYAHQFRVLERVLAEMDGRAILADEVGLGKTVEAGMVLKEYLLRGLVERALILVPATLIWQWYMELKDKFAIHAAIQRTVWDWERCPILIASLDTAKRSPHREAVLAQRYDLLLVDEAHRLKNRRSLNWQFVNQIHRRYCLLLTATPVQNDLDELHSLVTLLKPGHLGHSRNFQRLFALDPRRTKDPEQLREMLSAVIVRHRRGRHTVDFTPRHVHPVPVELSPAERHFYDALTDYVRGEARREQAATGGRPPALRPLLPLITLQKEAVSSAWAALLTLHKLVSRCQDPDEKAALQHLLSLAAAVRTSAKTDAVLQLLSQSDEQFIIFTEYRATQQYLRERLEQAGITHVGFDGSLSLGQREWAREWFRRHARVLVSTESGGEGINFQFCRNVIHFDLPWNPQRLEQRIGRVHRLGQTRPVHIYNLATRDTIEAYILYLLDEKLDLFRQVVGHEDRPWRQRASSFEAAIARIILSASSTEEIYAGLDQLGDTLAAPREPSPKDRLIERILGSGL